jgi:hypothetical protein
MQTDHERHDQAEIDDERSCRSPDGKKRIRASSKQVHAKYPSSMLWKTLAAGSLARGPGKRRSSLALRKLVFGEEDSVKCSSESSATRSPTQSLYDAKYRGMTSKESQGEISRQM